jgi:hypothetical protein
MKVAVWGAVVGGFGVALSLVFGIVWALIAWS